MGRRVRRGEEGKKSEALCYGNILLAHTHIHRPLRFSFDCWVVTKALR